MPNALWRLTVSVLLSHVASIVCNPVQIPLTQRPAKHATHGKHAAVSSESDICTQVGTELSEDGGNAADMMVGTVLCIGVVAMYHAGIGGGGFALIRSANGSFHSVDFREEAPAAADPFMFEKDPLSQLFGGPASGIPGELRGLEYIHSNFGALPWNSVVAPAVEIARQGWIVDKDLLYYMDIAVSRREDFFTEDPAWAVDFAPNGRRLQIGDRISRKQYANTLELIGEEGVDAFYGGWLANATVTANLAANGLFTLEDMMSYQAQVRDPIQVDYHDHTVTSCPAPAGGAAVLSILKTMEGYDIGKVEDTNLTTHRVNEAFRFAFGARTVMGDPKYIGNMAEFEEAMISDTHAADVRSKISDYHTLALKAYNPPGYDVLQNHGTSHIVTSDVSGLTVSLTSTVNFYFGSSVIVPETGVILNNQMADFSTPHPHPPFNHPPTPANFVAPRKRPLSACSPSIVTRRRSDSSAAVSPIGPPVLALGGAGGPRIITLVASLLMSLLPPYLPSPSLPKLRYSDRSPRPSLEEALALPRLHDSLVPNETSLEWPEPAIGIVGFDNGTAEFLRSRGHLITYVRPKYSAAHALAWECTEEDRDCGFVAAAEPRHLHSGGRVR